MGNSLESDFSVPIKDAKLKFGTQPFLTTGNICEKFHQNLGYLGHIGLLVWHGITLS